MSRFDFDDGDWDGHQALRQAGWQANLHRALVSTRGQKSLTELVDALAALPVHELHSGFLIERFYTDADDEEKLSGYEVCAIGAYALHKGAKPEDLPRLAGEDDLGAGYETGLVARRFGMRQTLGEHIAWLNDERFGEDTPAERWEHIRAWALGQIAAPQEA